MTENIENINNDLTLNAFFGNLDGVKYLLENGANINAIDSVGDTALICAVSMGHFKVVKYLVENGADIEKRDNKKKTALRLALDRGQLKIAECLIKKGADINTKDNSGDTALIWASKARNTKMRNTDVVEYLIKNKADVNEKNDNGLTALMYASYNLHLEIVKLLIENGAKVNEKNNGDWTALMYALDISNNLKIEKPLSESEEDIIANNNGYTTSKWDLFKRSVKLVEYLIKNGAKVNIKNKEGKTALDLAKNEEIKKLLEKAMGK